MVSLPGDFQLLGPHPRPMVCVNKPPSSFHPEGLRRWTTDKCSALVMTKYLCKEEHKILFDRENIPAHMKVGFSYPASLNFGRAVWYRSPQPVVLPNEDPPGRRDSMKIYESCRRHVGRYAIVNGYKTAMICSRRGFKSVLPNASIGTSFLATETKNKTLAKYTKRGRKYYIVPCETPRTVEVHMDSFQVWCGAVPI